MGQDGSSKMMHFHEKMYTMLPNERREYIRKRMKGSETFCGNPSNCDIENEEESSEEKNSFVSGINYI